MVCQDAFRLKQSATNLQRPILPKIHVVKKSPANAGLLFNNYVTGFYFSIQLQWRRTLQQL